MHQHINPIFQSNLLETKPWGTATTLLASTSMVGGGKALPLTHGEARVPIEDVVGGFGRFKCLSAEKVAQIFQ
jgi:hypothetical protein